MAGFNLLGSLSYTPVDGAGQPYAGALLYVYRAGTTTATASYTTSALSVANPHPVVADGNGRFANVWVDDAAAFDYRVRITDRDGVQIPGADYDNIPRGALTGTLVGQALYPQTAAEQANSVTPTSYLYAPPDIRRYGATGDGTADDATAFSNALLANDYAYVPEAPTAWRLNSTVSVPDNKGIRGEGLGSVIHKGANGAMFSLGRNSFIDDVFIDGKGATYTGVNITIPYTAEFEGYQRISRCRIFDSASYGVEYVSAAKAAGFASKIVDCDMRVRSDAVACVKWGDDPANSHGNRSIINCTSGSGPLVDVSNADNGFIIGNTIGDNGVNPGIIYGTAPQKVICDGNRIASTTKLTIRGGSHTFTNNVCASAVEMASGATGCRISANATAGLITDLSGGNSNEVDIATVSYAPTWTGGSSNPAIGNGTLAGYYTRQGRVIVYTFSLDIGSTTTMGTGEWRFSLPFVNASNQPVVGSAFIFDATGNAYAAIPFAAASGTYATLYVHGSNAVVSGTVPITFATGDLIRATLTYLSA